MPIYQVPDAWAEAKPRTMKGQGRNLAWLQKPPEAFRGLWVVLEDGKPIASSITRQHAIQTASAIPATSARLVACVPLACNPPFWW